MTGVTLVAGLLTTGATLVPRLGTTRTTLVARLLAYRSAGAAPTTGTAPSETTFLDLFGLFLRDDAISNGLGKDSLLNSLDVFLEGFLIDAQLIQ